MDGLSVSRPTTATVSLFFHGGEGNADSPRSFSAPSLPPGRRRPQEVTQSANPKFLEQVKEKFPDKESKLLIVCSDGRQRAIQVLMLLDAEGYTNIVGLKGGYIDWNFVFKGTGGNPLFQKLERRCAQPPNPPLDPRSLSFSLPPRVADVLSSSLPSQGPDRQVLHGLRLGRGRPRGPLHGLDHVRQDGLRRL